MDTFLEQDYDQTAEQSVLGSLILESNLIPLVMAELERNDFFLETSQIVYDTICGMYKAGADVDAVTVYNAASTQGITQEYVIELMTVTPTTANWRAYTGIVKGKSIDRQIKQLADELKTADDRSGIISQIAELDRRKRQAGFSMDSCSTANRIDEFVDYVKDFHNHPPVRTGYAQLDKIFHGGLHTGITILTSATSMGKSAFALSIANQAAADGRTVFYYLLEMHRRNLIARSLSSLTYKLDADNALTEWQVMSGSKYEPKAAAQDALLRQAINAFYRTARNLYVIMSRDKNKDFLTPQDIENDIAAWIASHPDEPEPLVVIDYLQLLKPTDGAGDSLLDTDNLTTVLMHISAQYSIPMLAITSQSRTDSNKNDSMSGGKGSGLLEYSADNLLRLQFAKKPKNAENAETVDRENRKGETDKTGVTHREIEIAIMKNRTGKTGDVVNFEYTSTFGVFTETGINGKQEQGKAPIAIH